MQLSRLCAPSSLMVRSKGEAGRLMHSFPLSRGVLPDPDMTILNVLQSSQLFFANKRT
jgi:hypothetical protein